MKFSTVCFHISIKKIVAVIVASCCFISASSQVIFSESKYDKVGMAYNEKKEFVGVNVTDLTGKSLEWYNVHKRAPYNSFNFSGNIPFTFFDDGSYCLPTYQSNTNCASDPIAYVVLNTLSNGNTLSCGVPNNYTNIAPAGLTTTDLNPGFVYNLQLGLNGPASFGGGGVSLGVWIDYNDNYLFEASERITDQRHISAVGPGLYINIPLSVPGDAPLGMHRMRIRETSNTQEMAVPPCDIATNLYVDGETEDYTINIVAAPACTGGVSVGGIASANQAVCIGSLPAPISISGNTGNVLFWQSSFDDAFNNPTNIEVTSTTLNIASEVSGSVYYRAVVQNNNCAPAYSSTTLITATYITAGTQLAVSGQSSSGTNYFINNCKLIASATPGFNFPGAVVTVKIDGAIQNYNGRPYLQRHYDYQPGYREAGSSSILTLYYLQSEFTAFNSARGSLKPLPTTGSNSDPDIANIRMIHYEGVDGSGDLNPGTYSPGTASTLIPQSVNWDAAHNWWEVVFATPGLDGMGGYFIQTLFDCLPPSTSVSNVSPSDATVFWNVISGTSGYEYAVQTTNTTPAGAGTATTNTLVNLNGLTANTNYYFFLRTVCDPGNFSSWVSTNFFTGVSSTVNVGIGTNTPSSNLEISSTGIPDVRISSSNSFGPARLSLLSDKGSATEWRPGYIESGNNGDYTGRLDFYTNGTSAANRFGAVKAMSVSNGNLSVSGIVTANGNLLSSDARYKTEITTLVSPLHNLLQLRGTAYYFNREAFPSMNFSSIKQMGLIAQEVEKIFPELVNTDKDGYKSINYTGLIPVMIESIKEQQHQIDELKKLVESMIKNGVKPVDH